MGDRAQTARTEAAVSRVIFAEASHSIIPQPACTGGGSPLAEASRRPVQAAVEAREAHVFGAGPLEDLNK